MRVILSAILLTGLTSAPALASDVQSAFDLLGQHTAEISTRDHVKLSATTPMATAKRIDATFMELYGEPTQTRAGLKVWEVDGATMMCGPDMRGGVYISADRRKPTMAPPARELQSTRRSEVRPQPVFDPRSQTIAADPRGD